MTILQDYLYEVGFKIYSVLLLLFRIAIDHMGQSSSEVALDISILGPYFVRSTHIDGILRMYGAHELTVRDEHHFRVESLVHRRCDPSHRPFKRVYCKTRASTEASGF